MGPDLSAESYRRILIPHNDLTVDLVVCNSGRGQEIRGIFINSSRCISLQKDGSKDGERWAELIREFLDGRIRNFPHLPLDMNALTSFQKRVLDTARTVEWGRTLSYSGLASIAGHPKAIRAAASVMAANPFPLIIPCHRIIHSDGSSGGFMGEKKGPAVELKKWLLQREQYSG